jgi:alkylation response protein AidB-like acyl-CoA dehydrogenase
MAREYAEKTIAPLAAQIDHENKVPDKILEDLAELGLFGIPYPEEYGGSEGGYEGYVLAMEQISRICGGVAMTISAHCMTLSTIMAFGTEEQKRKFMISGLKDKILSVAYFRAGTGSDPQNSLLPQRKRRRPYIINGSNGL